MTYAHILAQTFLRWVIFIHKIFGNPPAPLERPQGPTNIDLSASCFYKSSLLYLISKSLQLIRPVLKAWPFRCHWVSLFLCFTEHRIHFITVSSVYKHNTGNVCLQTQTVDGIFTINYGLEWSVTNILTSRCRSHTKNLGYLPKVFIFRCLIKFLEYDCVIPIYRLTGF